MAPARPGCDYTACIVRREIKTAKTRAHIIEAARKLLVRDDFGGLAMEAVARAARVTRVTIYNQFSNKVGLLGALFEDAGRRMKVTDAFAALALPDPRAALEALVRANCKAWSRDRRVLQRVVALAAIDPDATAVLARYEGRRAHDADLLIARLSVAKLLARGVTPAHAAGVVTVVTGFQVYDQLATSLPHAQVVDAILRITSALLR